MSSIPDSLHELFEKETFAHFGTVTPSGAPHVTPVWIDYDPEADRLLVNTERGRQKEQNVRSTPAVGLSMVDPENPYEYLSVIGEVTEITTDGAVIISTNSRDDTRGRPTRCRLKPSE